MEAAVGGIVFVYYLRGQVGADGGRIESGRGANERRYAGVHKKVLGKVGKIDFLLVDIVDS